MISQKVFKSFHHHVVFSTLINAHMLAVGPFQTCFFFFFFFQSGLLLPYLIIGHPIVPGLNLPQQDMFFTYKICKSLLNNYLVGMWPHLAKCTPPLLSCPPFSESSMVIKPRILWLTSWVSIFWPTGSVQSSSLPLASMARSRHQLGPHALDSLSHSHKVHQEWLLIFPWLYCHMEEQWR